MELHITRDGRARCVYGEAIDLRALGPLRISRASHVEPDPDGRWWADLAPVGGPRLGPFTQRSEALAAEADWLQSDLFEPRFPRGEGAANEHDSDAKIAERLF